MEVTNALLVAMMFIVLITMGVGNIIMALAAIREKLVYSNVPDGLRGLGITFIITCIISLTTSIFLCCCTCGY